MHRTNQAPLAQVSRFLIVFALLLLGSMHFASADVLTLHQGADTYEPGRHLSYLEDAGAQLRIEDIIQRPHAAAFLPAPSSTPGFGFSDSAYWFRLALKNSDSPVSDWILETQFPLLDDIRVYLVYPDNRIVSHRSGDLLPFSERAIAHRNFTFPVALAARQEATVYIRVKTESAVLMPLVLWSPKAFLEHVDREQYGFGLYYGVLLALFFYNLLIYLSIRDINYLYYLHYIGGWILFQLAVNGLAFKYLWPESPWWGNRAMPFFLAFVGFGVVQFTRGFLRLKKNMPKLDRLMRFALWLAVAMMASSLVLRYGLVIRLANGLALIGVLAILIAGLVSLRMKVMQARYFMLAWACILLGSAVFILKQFGILPSVFITEYGMQIGSALEVILLSLALAHRLQMLKDENVRIQQEATELLEQRVQQRTRELDSALKELSIASEKLKDLSRTDALTGCRNRTCFDELMGAAWQGALRAKRPVGLLMLDIDHFKQINDTHGHPCGDACLRQVADGIKELVRRPGDETFRYGGEEFAILLPDTDLAGASHVGKTILRKVASLTITYDGQAVPITVSIGAASIVPAPDTGWDALIYEADKALYEAKRRGRNQVCYLQELQ